MHSSNPFADDAPAEAGQRLESAGSPLNPYAAPAGSVEKEGDGPGVGIWRHKDYVVLHRAADFPDRCIFTNEPAKFRWTQTHSVFKWGGLGPNYAINFSYGLSADVRWQWFAKWLRSLTVVGVWLLIVFILAIVDSQLFTLGGSSFALIALQWVAALGPFVWLYAAYRLWRGWYPLRVIYTDGRYLLIKGAQLAFLSSLPRWPGLYAKGT